MSTLEKSLLDLLKEIDDPRRDIILAIYNDHKDLFHYSAGSGYNHQAWPGGYADHIAECLRINDLTYDSLLSLRPLNFSKASAAIVLFLHDVEKPFRYGPLDHPKCKALQENTASDYEAWEVVKWDTINDWKDQYGLTLTDDEINGLIYTHGEGNDHQKNARVSCPLAAHVHHCDNTSARIWHDKGQGLAMAETQPISIHSPLHNKHFYS